MDWENILGNGAMVSNDESNEWTSVIRTWSQKDINNLSKSLGDVQWWDGFFESLMRLLKLNIYIDIININSHYLLAILLYNFI